MRIHGENGDMNGGSSHASGDESQSMSNAVPNSRNLTVATSSSQVNVGPPNGMTASQHSSSQQSHVVSNSHPSQSNVSSSKAFPAHASHPPSMLAFRNPRDRVVLRYHCIHPNCKRSFKDESELRSHLIAYNPGMAAENQFLRDSVLTLLDFLEKAGKQIPSIQQAVSVLYRRRSFYGGVL